LLPPAKDRFKTYVASTGHTTAPLPLGHTLEFVDFVNLMHAPQMARPECDVYRPERLIYYFYGRPAYKPLNRNESVSIGAFNLAGLVFDASTMPPPHRIMPFDSGALEAGLYNHAVHTSLKREHFELNPELSSAQKIVSKFFGSNKNYYLGRAAAPLAHPQTELEAHAYQALIGSRNATKADDRRATIEFQFDIDVDITSIRPMCVILPGDVIDAQIEEFVTITLGADLIEFVSYHDRADADAYAIREAARKYLDAKGLLP